MTQLLSPLRIAYRPRIPDQMLLLQARAALALPVSRLQAASAVRAESLVIAGGGPSLVASLDKLMEMAAAGAKVIATNEVPHFLAAHGIVPWAAIHLGPVELTVRCIGRPVPGTRYFIASICPIQAFAAVSNSDAIMWHAFSDNPDVDALLAAEGHPLARGGQTATLRAIGVGWILGFRHFHLVGADSSTDIDLLHPYPSVSDGVEEYRIQLRCGERLFETIPELAGQVQDFIEVYRDITSRGGTITVHGDGLLPLVWRALDRGDEPPPRLVPGQGPEVVMHALRF